VVESSVPRARLDPLSDYFNHILSEKGLVDIVPIKLIPSWRNKRVGEEYIAKILDWFLIVGKMIESPLLCKQWIGCGGESDHHPIFLEVAGRSQKPVIPFKFNSTWIKDEDFISLVNHTWVPIDPSEDSMEAV
jgi:hypothetical protein